MRQIEQAVETSGEYQLSQTEISELTHLETTIERNLKVFIEVGEALLTIRDKRLYRSSHGNFDDYCRDRWRMSKTQANRLIGAADVALDLAPIGVTPSSESVARPLVPLTTKQRQEVWQQVVSSAPNGKPTASDVSKAVQKHKKPSSVTKEIEAQGKSLGFPTRGDSVMPESDHIDELTHTSAVEVIDIPFAASNPAVDSWGSTQEFSVTVNDGSIIKVKFQQPYLLGGPHHFEFFGAVSSTNYRSHFILDAKQDYATPKDYAQVCAEKFHTGWMEELTNNSTHPEPLQPKRNSKVLLPAKPLGRVENDFYRTNALLTKTLLSEVDVTGRIIEPCAGDGAIANELPSKYITITNDLYPPAGYKWDYKLDATALQTWQQWKDLRIDWVVTNPPYSRAHEIIPLAFEHAKVGVAVLLRLSYLEPCANRADWLKDNSDQLCKIIPLNPRPSFRNDTQGSDNVTVLWMVWRKDFSWKRLGIECPFKFVSGWNAK